MPSDRILELSKKLVDAREKYSKLKAQSTEAEKEKKEIERELFHQMEIEGYQNFTHDELGTFYRSEYLWCRIMEPEKAFEYLREQGVFDEIMKLKPESARLNQLIKENYLKKGEPVPEDNIGISITLSPRVGRRKGGVE